MPERGKQAGLSRRLRAEQRFAYFSIAPALLIVFGVIVVPIFVTLMYSVRNMSPLSSHYGEFAGLGFYISVLRSAEFWQDLGRTLYFTVFSTLLETIAGIFVALLLNEKFFGVKFLRTIIIIPWALPTVVNASVWKLIFNGEYGVFNAILQRLHIFDTYQSWLGNPGAAMNMIIIADSWKMTPLAVIFFLAALQNISRDAYEAALVDGAGAVRRFFMLTIPYLRPTILVVVIMRTVEKFKAFDIFYIMTRGGPSNSTRTLMYDAYLKAFSHMDYSGASTYAYLIAFVVMALTVIYIRVEKEGGRRLG
ncbi:MAG: sugar ABC transporter permease [Spirochaetaceae bacterium]|nr:sugar ABC transporter permease [Spirochaetaceae bacterium]